MKCEGTETKTGLFEDMQDNIIAIVQKKPKLAYKELLEDIEAVFWQKYETLGFYDIMAYKEAILYTLAQFSQDGLLSLKRVNLGPRRLNCDYLMDAKETEFMAHFDLILDFTALNKHILDYGP